MAFSTLLTLLVLPVVVVWVFKRGVPLKEERRDGRFVRAYRTLLLLAIMVIAVFYSSGISPVYAGAAVGIWVFLFILGRRFKVYNLVPYIIGGVVMWYCMLHSGIHATIAGVLLAFCILIIHQCIFPVPVPGQSGGKIWP